MLRTTTGQSFVPKSYWAELSGQCPPRSTELERGEQFLPQIYTDEHRFGRAPICSHALKAVKKMRNCRRKAIRVHLCKSVASRLLSFTPNFQSESV